MVPQNYIKLTARKPSTNVGLSVEALEEHDDVQHVTRTSTLTKAKFQAALAPKLIASAFFVSAGILPALCFRQILLYPDWRPLAARLKLTSMLVP